MKTFLKLTLAVCLLTGFSLKSFAQKSVSAADKKKIIQIFKDVDPSEYKLVFGKEEYGKKRIKMDQLKRVSKFSKAEALGVKWTLIVGDRSDNEVFYIYSEGEAKMASLLGKNKLRALQDIASKYNDIGRGR